MFTDVPEIAAAEVTVLTALVVITLAFALGLAIAYIYRKTHRGFSYSPSFVFTIIIVSILSAIVMTVVENSLARAFAILGTFTIIRYRTAIKDTRDTAFLLWAIVTGLAVGTVNYSLAVVSTGLVSAIILTLSRFNFGSLDKHDALLYFTSRTGPEQYEDDLTRYCSSHRMLSMRTTHGVHALAYSITPRSDHDARALVTALDARPGTSNVELVTTRDDIE